MAYSELYSDKVIPPFISCVVLLLSVHFTHLNVENKIVSLVFLSVILVDVLGVYQPTSLPVPNQGLGRVGELYRRTRLRACALADPSQRSV